MQTDSVATGRDGGADGAWHDWSVRVLVMSNDCGWNRGREIAVADERGGKEGRGAEEESGEGEEEEWRKER